MAHPDQNRRAFHPAVSVFSWFSFALAVELAHPAQLIWLAAVAALLLADAAAGRRFLRLIWRARWLWLALFLIYAWTMPGRLLWAHELSPTLEGMEAAALRILRLLLLLAALARLLAECPPRRLAGGLYLIARPFAFAGLDARALAVRLALTLERLEHAPPAGKWREMLNQPVRPVEGPDEITLLIPAVGGRDAWMLAASAALLLMVLTRVSA